MNILWTPGIWQKSEIKILTAIFITHSCKVGYNKPPFTLLIHSPYYNLMTDDYFPVTCGSHEVTFQTSLKFRNICSDLTFLGRAFKNFTPMCEERCSKAFFDVEQHDKRVLLLYHTD
jgi:hypothetical protein